MRTAKKTKQDKKPKKSNCFLAQLAAAGFSGDHQKLELISLTAIRSLKSAEPEVALQLSNVLSKITANPKSLRWAENPPPPSDTEHGASLLQFPDTVGALSPILSEKIKKLIQDVILQRKESELLLAEGVRPPTSILLKGAPGTGKTALSSWLAQQLGLPLVVLDLASTVSSYLGKTGSNLQRSLNYARSTPCVLLLDEFDSIAKKRNDQSDVGELNRIVNVLLKELENWSLFSYLIAATNHPEILDPAIERRFDTVLEIPLPGPEERKLILDEKLGRFANEVPLRLRLMLSTGLSGCSGSDIESLCVSALRSHLIDRSPLTQCLCQAYLNRIGSEIPKSMLPEIIDDLKKNGGMTMRTIGEFLGKSPSTIQHHLNKLKKDV